MDDRQVCPLCQCQDGVESRQVKSLSKSLEFVEKEHSAVLKSLQEEVEVLKAENKGMYNVVTVIMIMTSYVQIFFLLSEQQMTQNRDMKLEKNVAAQMKTKQIGISFKSFA